MRISSSICFGPTGFPRRMISVMGGSRYLTPESIHESVQDVGKSPTSEIFEGTVCQCIGRKIKGRTGENLNKRSIKQEEERRFRDR